MFQCKTSYEPCRSRFCYQQEEINPSANFFPDLSRVRSRHPPSSDPTHCTLHSASTGASGNGTRCHTTRSSTYQRIRILDCMGYRVASIRRYLTIPSRYLLDAMAHRQPAAQIQPALQRRYTIQPRGSGPGTPTRSHHPVLH